MDPLSQFAEQNNEESLNAPEPTEPEIQSTQDIPVVEEEEAEDKERDQVQEELRSKEAPTSSVFNLSSYDVTQELNEAVQVTDGVLSKVVALL
jgi:ribosome assembly protein YihI (activator of Der GTPase)